ncbi:hypothetical protein [Brucella intermedia]|uniref:hypothetical protein n=1 Tax=Brucella intermedia TaxID=94625 RepID=UPI0018A933C9|nr:MULTISPECIES: hypothetical protein [Brucella/Ochrobactrum group]
MAKDNFYHMSRVKAVLVLSGKGKTGSPVLETGQDIAATDRGTLVIATDTKSDIHRFVRSAEILTLGLGRLFLCRFFNANRLAQQN